MCNFFGRLLEERKRLELTQDEMAKAGGVGKRTYCNYESGERSPDADFLMAIAAAGADVQYILVGVRSGAALAEPQLDPPVALSSWEKAHIENLRACEKEDRDAIGRMAIRSAKAQHTEVKTDRRKAR